MFLGGRASRRGCPGPPAASSSWPADAKYRPPPFRRGLVPRTALIDRVWPARGVPVVCVTAPPGYGKTTLLAQLARRKRLASAWVSVDPADNDTAALLVATARALDRIEPIDPEVFRSLASPAAATAAAGVARMSSALSSRQRPFRLVLDNAETLENPECVDVVAELATRLPDGSQLAVATRGRPPLPTGLFRSRRQLVEVGAADLAMTEAEAAALFGDAERVARLVATLAQPTFATGRVDTTRRWFGWFSQRRLVVQYPHVAFHAAWVEALVGHPGAALEWADAAERGHFDGRLPDGSTVDAWLAFLRAYLTRHGVAQMRADARSAWSLLAPGSMLRAAALTVEGIACVLGGDDDEADTILARRRRGGARWRDAGAHDGPGRAGDPRHPARRLDRGRHAGRTSRRSHRRRRSRGLRHERSHRRGTGPNQNPCGRHPRGENRAAPGDPATAAHDLRRAVHRSHTRGDSESPSRAVRARGHQGGAAPTQRHPAPTA